jgi:hypothetical protein
VGVCIDIRLEMSSGIQTPNNEALRSPETKAQFGRSSGEKSSTSTSKEDTSDLLGLEGENGIGCLNLEGRGRRSVESDERVNLMD